MKAFDGLQAKFMAVTGLALAVMLAVIGLIWQRQAATRDEVLRLLAVEPGITMAEIGRRLQITRQWAAQLAGVVTKQEIDAMRASVSSKK